MKNKSRILTVFMLSLFMMTMVPMMLTENSIVSAEDPSPIVTTNTSTDINCTTTILNGYVSDNGSSENTYQYFKYIKNGSSYGDYLVMADPVPSDFIIVGRGDFGAPYLIKKYWRNNLTLNDESSDFGNYQTSLTSDNTYLFAGSIANWNINQYWLSNMTLRKTAGYSGSDNIQNLANDYLYVYSTTVGQLHAYYKTNMSVVNHTIPIPPFTINYTQVGGGGACRGLCTDYAYIYVGCYNGNVTQIWKSNLTIRTNITLGTSLSAYNHLARDGTFLYSVGTQHKVRQYWISNLSFKKESADLGSAINYICVGKNGSYVFVGAGNNIYQLYARNMSIKKTTSFGYLVKTITTDYNFVYVGGDTINYLRKYWMSNMTLSSSINTGNTVQSLNIPPKYRPAFHVAISDLIPGYPYDYQAYADNTNSTGNGLNRTVLTKPFAPPNESYFILRRIYGFGVNITWTKGLGANNTVIRVSNTGYPTSPTTGSPVCNITGTTYNHSIAVPVIYWYYSAWSFTKWGKFDDYTCYSPNATRGVIVMWENPVFLEGPVSQPSLSRLNLVMQLTNLSYDTYANIGYEYGTTAGLGSTSPLTNVSSTGTYTMTGNRFSPDTTYYLRMFATNHNGTSYGTLFTFHTSADSANYLVFNVLPIVIAVAIVGLIVMVALTGNLLTKEGLIVILTITILGIIVIQIITSL